MQWLLVDGWSLIFGALLVLLLPLPWLAAAVLAAAWHEACHALAVVALGGRVTTLRIGFWGMHMETSPMEPLPGAICALAGPAGSLALLLLRPWVPQVAAWGLFQGCFNLLPIFPLDGGQAMDRLLPKGRVWVERIVLGALGLAALYGAFRGETGELPLLMVAGLAFGRKKPCKNSRFRVQ